MMRDSGPDRKGDQQGVQFGDSVDGLPRGPELEDGSEPSPRPLEHDEISLGNMARVPGMTGEKRREIQRSREPSINDIDGRERVRVEFH